MRSCVPCSKICFYQVKLSTHLTLVWDVARRLIGSIFHISVCGLSTHSASLFVILLSSLSFALLVYVPVHSGEIECFWRRFSLIQTEALVNFATRPNFKLLLQPSIKSLKKDKFCFVKIAIN